MTDINTMIAMKKSGTAVRKYLPASIEEVVDLMNTVYSEAMEIGLEKFDEYDEKVYDRISELNDVLEEFYQAVLRHEGINRRS